MSSTTLAQSLLKRSNGVGPTRGIDGFVVELSPAGGHNAPPRGWHFEPSDQEEPVYGEKDVVDVKSFAKVAKGLPFWFAGKYGRKVKLAEVLNNGGTGIQVIFFARTHCSTFALTHDSSPNVTLRSGPCLLCQMSLEWRGR